jgi:cytoskeleton protein RodZ
MPFDLCKIGQLLKTTREEKGLTYEEVSKALFIRKRVIEAIEAGNWEVLPHPVYVRGYVTQYASFLKIEDAVEAAMLPPAPPVPEAPVAHVAPHMEETTTVVMPKKEREKRASWWAWEPKKKIVGAAMMGAVVVGFLVFQNLPKPSYAPAPAQSGASSQQQTTLAAPMEAASTVPAAEASPYQTVETSGSQPIEASPSQPASPGPYDKQEERIVLETKKLTIACQERTWVRIIIDGTETKEFTLNPEEVVMLNAKDRFDLLIGNAAGVKLIYNGKDVGLTGQVGEVKHINLS